VSNCDSSSESDEDSDSEEELEIVGMAEQPLANENDAHDVAAMNGNALTDDDTTGILPPPPVAFTKLQQADPPRRKASPKSITAYFNSRSTTRTTGAMVKTQKVFRNPRALLKKKLKAKQFENGNKWLAR
jgi:hypothetical protein